MRWTKAGVLRASVLQSVSLSHGCGGPGQTCILQNLIFQGAEINSQLPPPSPVSGSGEIFPFSSLGPTHREAETKLILGGGCNRLALPQRMSHTPWGRRDPSRNTPAPLPHQRTSRQNPLLGGSSALPQGPAAPPCLSQPELARCS